MVRRLAQKQRPPGRAAQKGVPKVSTSSISALTENCNTLQVFNYEQNDIRTVMIDGDPWFVAVDICAVLEIQNAADALNRLDEDERGRFNLGRQGEANIVSESGLYSLVLGSRKPEAKTFKRWITHEVIPSIRRTGAYAPQPMSQLEIMRNMLDAQIQSERRIDRLEAKIQTALEKPVIVDWCKWANDKINLIVESQGLNHQKYRGDLYAELEQTARCNIEARQTQLRRRMRESGHTYKECKAVSKLHVIDADPKLRAIFEGIVKRESARYL
jgi:prophage antirepressor-like protein